jgi:hypothetical protein
MRRPLWGCGSSQGIPAPLRVMGTTVRLVVPTDLTERGASDLTGLRSFGGHIRGDNPATAASKEPQLVGISRWSPRASAFVGAAYAISTREPTALRCRPMEPPPTSSTPLQLAPGMQAYVQVQAVPNWEVGSTAGGASFAVLTMSPQEAQAYMPTMTNLGQR